MVFQVHLKRTYPKCIEDFCAFQVFRESFIEAKGQLFSEEVKVFYFRSLYLIYNFCFSLHVVFWMHCQYYPLFIMHYLLLVGYCNNF